MTRRFRRWALYMALLCLVFFLYYVVSFSSTLQLKSSLVPWSDHNQELENVTLAFKDLNLIYQLHSAKSADACDGKKVLVLVASGPSNAKQRAMARRTWANKAAILPDFLVRFVVGGQPNYDTEMNLYVEKHEHADLIRYNILDNYENLVFKTAAMLQWQREFCPQVKYVVKIDDDTVVDLERIQYLIKNQFDPVVEQYKTVIFCKSHVEVEPIRNPFSKWYVPWITYSNSTFPDYCSGGIYLLTSSAIPPLLGGMQQKKLLQIEDVFFTGIIRHAMNVSLHSFDVFCTKHNDNRNLCAPLITSRLHQRIAQCDVHLSDYTHVYGNLRSAECNNAFKGIKMGFSILLVFCVVLLVL